MRRGKHRKFGRVIKVRASLYRSLATALVDHGRITTTVAKAKSLSGYVNKLITNAKKNSISATRLLSKDVGTVTATKLVKEIGPKFNTKNGGYTRMIKKGQRISDGAPMAIIEWSI
jgi:large subunit ribosomal protein L17